MSGVATALALAFAAALSTGCYGALFGATAAAVVVGGTVAGPVIYAEELGTEVDMLHGQVGGGSLSADPSQVGATTIHDGYGAFGDLHAVLGRGRLGLLTDGRVEVGHYGADRGYGWYGTFGQRLGPTLRLARGLRVGVAAGYQYGGYIQSGHEVPVGARLIASLGPVLATGELHRTWRWPSSSHVPDVPRGEGGFNASGGHLDLGLAFADGDRATDHVFGLRLFGEDADGVQTSGIGFFYGIVGGRRAAYDAD